MNNQKHENKQITLGRLLAIGVMTVLLQPMQAYAGVITNLPANGGLSQVEHYEPIGQSFTAEDLNVSAGLYFHAINPSWSNDDPLKYELYAGDGTSGTLLDTSTFSLSTGFVGLHMVDFSATSLTVGSMYSLVAYVLGDSPHWGLGRAQAYTGGSPIRHGNPVNGLDFGFRVEPAGPIPEPTTLTLMGLGLAGLGFRRRKIKAKQ